MSAVRWASETPAPGTAAAAAQRAAHRDRRWAETVRELCAAQKRVERAELPAKGASVLSVTPRLAARARGRLARELQVLVGLTASPACSSMVSGAGARLCGESQAIRGPRRYFLGLIELAESPANPALHATARTRGPAFIAFSL